ncbi:MAG: DUF1573 domain-containing protein [Verrucomicrobiota bacterium]
MLKIPGVAFFAMMVSIPLCFGQAPGAPEVSGPPELPPFPTLTEPTKAPATSAPTSVQPQSHPKVAGPRLPILRPQVPRPGAPIQPAMQPRPNAVDEVLAWDSVNKEYTAAPGEMSAHFSFSVTNISKQDVTINWVRPSCGCTVAKLPPTPWKLTSGESGSIEFTVDLRGKFGTLSKYVTIDSSAGQKMLALRLTIPSPVVSNEIDARTRNMRLAMADRQAVFKNDCATCHLTPTIGRTGEALYRAGCAICHDAPHRATMVPDLRALKVPTSREFWVQAITHGKPGSLMPAFAQSEGGPLTQAQIDSLADYLVESIKPQPAPSVEAKKNSATP